MNETEYVALIFILKENQKKREENKKSFSKKTRTKMGEHKKKTGKNCGSIQEEWWKGEADRFAGYKRRRALIFGPKENQKKGEEKKN